MGIFSWHKVLETRAPKNATVLFFPLAISPADSFMCFGVCSRVTPAGTMVPRGCVPLFFAVLAAEDTHNLTNSLG